jgi:hypothetical protein
VPIKTAATATATVVGGVVTGLNLTGNGAGYITAPAVTISGSGSGASAVAILTDDNVTALLLAAGGSGYFVADPQNLNPNRDTIAVQVWDKYGNALEGYKVTFEIIGQGTTTAGTVNTYHPYAHFEAPAHDYTDSKSVLHTAGLGDRNPNVDANPIWQTATGDDDYAWGYTLNHQINFKKSLASAAHVDLVLDELTPRSVGHFTDIVNIKVYGPTGVLVKQQEVTKVWSNVPPAEDKVTIELSKTNVPDYTWVPSLTTNLTTAWYKIAVLDQYGDPFTTAHNVYIRVLGPASGLLTGVVVTPTNFSILTWPAGTYTLAPFIDMNNSGTFDSGDISGVGATLVIQ